MQEKVDFPNRKATRKYTSQAGDLVIGRIINRAGDYYRVDIGDRFDGMLQYYDFEGATKRNRPQIDNNSLIYARVQESNLHMNPVLTCKSNFNKKTWSSGEAQFGPILGGYVMDVPIPLCQKLLKEEGISILQSLGNAIKFEIVIGYNGKIWINSGNSKHTILLANALMRADTMSHQEFRDLVERIRRIS
ncbi:unnamed protein product [Blepharisma stoltei]|uniref:K Homology domain-containing protein n=1 Tax=Blepharisma stoltei TaxID=1481888 RepID=A0AAU9IIR7_9CILI|nr:unnamed protein product [Blepharisma stoltei]